MNDLAKTVNEMERMRRQLLDKKEIMKAAKKAPSEIKLVDSLHQELMEMENELIQLKYTGTGQDFVRFPTKLASKLSYVGTSAAIADFAPADSFVEVYEELHGKLEKVLKDFQVWKEGKMKEMEESPGGLINEK
jgi:hypothetical protein